MPRLRSIAFACALLLGAVPVARAEAEAPPQVVVPHFTDVTAGSGIDVTGLGNASSWIDYDGDGDLDLLATNSSIPTADTWLYRNDGGGHFTDVTQAAGLGPAQIRSVAWGDYDNDGRPDLAATAYTFNDRTRLYHNNGGTTFTDVHS